jgi:hypothetical protein
MNCYRCGSDKLVLAPLTPYERESYARCGTVMRVCEHCGLEQSHAGDDEPMDALVAAQESPDV